LPLKNVEHFKTENMSKYILMGLSLLVLFASCRKAFRENNTLADPLKWKTISTALNYHDYPVVDNGMLVFRDNEHYDRYIDFLNEAIASDTLKDTAADAHSVLQDIENGLGFCSLRSIAHAEFMRQNVVGWSTLEAIPNEHFINSIDLRSVLNDRLELKIGNDLVHYISKDFVVRIDAGETSLINRYRSLGANATLDDVLCIDRWQQHTTVTQLTGEGFTWDKVIPQPVGDYHIAKPYTSFPDPCNNANLVLFKKIALSWHFEPPLEASFKINYGDGSAEETKYSVPSLGGYEVPWFSHTYPAAGTYNVTIRAYLMNGTYAANRTEEVKVAGNCQVVEKNSGWRQQILTVYPDRAVGGRLYVEFYGSVNQKMRMISETRSMVYKSGSWTLKSGRIEVEAQCAARNDACAEIDLLQAYQLKGDHKELLEHRSKNQRFYWNMASSKHYLTVHEERTMLPIILTSCP
jgi:hypothetical protein